MEMTYDGALVMPSSYAIMDEDEMTYLEGGKTYKGAKALQELSNMAHVVFGHAVSVASLAKVLTGGLVASGTGIGCVVALGAALGISWNIALGVTNAIMLGMATYYYAKYKGFKQTSQSIFGVTLYTSVSKIR